MLSSPGIYHDMPSAEYFADPCPSPSFTQSLAKIVLDQSPLHAWHAHPKLNPDYRHDDDTKFDIGNVAHKLLIGRGKDLEIFDAPDWSATGMGKGAKTKLHAERDAARAAGKVAVLQKTVTRANNMVTAAREQLDLRDLGHLFRDGAGEVVVAWNERDQWLRQMIDWLTPDRRTFVDFKTTDMSAEPHGLGRMMVNAGWPIQAAMAERGLGAVDPLGYRRRYLFVVQEATRPYALSVVEISEAALTMGRKQLDHAIDIWARCMRENVFPSYPLDIVTPEYPGWAEQQWLDREIHEAARERMPIAPDHLMAG